MSIAGSKEAEGLVSQIAFHCANHPDRPAITFDQTTLSYQQLAQRCVQLVRMLESSGVSRGDVVGIALERSLDLIPSIVAVMAMGAVYMPIDLDYPADRLQMMFEDAKPAAILSTAAVRERLPAEAPAVLNVEDATSSGGSLTPVQPGLLDPAYVIFTSGSTGRPKGVVNSHGGILNRLQWMQDQFQLNQADKVLQKTPIGFDVSVWELLWPLLVGAQIVVARPGAHRDAALLANIINQAGVTFVHFVPSMLALFVDQHNLRGRCRSLRTIVTSGEALSIELANRCQRALDAELHNLYGPTEAAIDVTHWHCRADNQREFMPIGYPISGCRIYILGQQAQPVPDGQTGEIYIAGIQVALGYIGRADLTAERFMDDPFHAGSRMYRSGDLGRIHPDGAIEFLGRVDDQIKLHGNRIELAEIVLALESLSSIKQAAVLTTKTEPPDLVAYYIPAAGPVGDGDIVSALEQTLPDYMLPRYLIPMSEFPTTQNGKLDRKALPEAVAEPAPAGAPPQNDLERFVAGQWEQLLNLRDVPRDIGFFDLGGSSINAARFINIMQRELDEFVYVVSVFEHPTVAEYAAFLQRDYADALGQRFGMNTVVARSDHSGVTEDTIAQFQSCVPLIKSAQASTQRNPKMVFILSPPRSGTTLMRVMLAGHSALFSATELQLLNFQTLVDRDRAYRGKFSLWNEGLLRCITELKGIDPEQAKALVRERIEQNTTTQQMYSELQQWIEPRILVDKSPAYAIDADALNKAETDFSDAVYVHLVRHPVSVVDSFVNYHMDQVLYMEPHTFSPAQLGELVWTVSHRNIVNFLEQIPTSRQCRVMFEDLVSKPDDQMRTVLAAIGVDFDAAVLDPYGNVDAKMVDGLHADSTPMGDTHFLDHGTIDASVADRHKHTRTNVVLGEPTMALAAQFGYSNQADLGEPTRTRGGRRRRKRR